MTATTMKPLAPRSEEFFEFKRPATHSGRATLVPLHDPEAKGLTPGELLIATHLATGGVAVRVERVREDAYGDWNPKANLGGVDPRKSCHVIETTRVDTGLALSFAPSDLCRVHESRKARA